LARRYRQVRSGHEVIWSRNSAQSPILLAYPRETVVAEKFEALVKLGIAER